MPALNELLAPYGIALGDAVLEGQATIDGEQVYCYLVTRLLQSLTLHTSFPLS